MNSTLQTSFLHILQGQQSAAQVLIFVLNSFRKIPFPQNFFLSLVDGPIIWEHRKKTF